MSREIQYVCLAKLQKITNEIRDTQPESDWAYRMSVAVGHLANEIDGEKISDDAMLAVMGFCCQMADAVDPKRLANQRAKKTGGAGGVSKKQRYEPIKQWALKESANMRGSDKQLARRLSGLLPKHLNNISEDPERLIYDTLRNKKT